MSSVRILHTTTANQGEADDAPVRARDSFRAEFMRQRAGAMRKYHNGECNNKPACFESCEYSAYCSEWKHTVNIPYF